MDYFQNKCPECGEPVFTASHRDISFCSKQCETNYIYRKKRFGASRIEERPSKDKVRRF